MIGNRIAHYQITGKLGRGGMGVVYRAKDMKLGREVALKLVPEEMASDPRRLDRLRREARTVAALNHPAIVTIFSVEEAEDIHFLTMELIEGQTLDALIPKGGLALERLFELAIPIADALATAHDRHIIHRDLKPGNVMVAHQGDRVKVLDFGLAKIGVDPAAAIDSQLPTVDMTRAGAIVGTPHYMSPEQARGAAVDHRSDVFSLGVMVFEMATGERPFRGVGSVEVLSSVLKDPAPVVTEIKPGLPRHLGRIIGRCLEKAPDDRFQTARDVYNELRGLRNETLSGAISPAWPSESIAVLPFANMSPDPDQDYFCDGMAEEIINTLARIRSLRVTPRTSSFRYKGSEIDGRAIGRQLGVTHLLEGSVRKAGDTLRISVQLVDVAAGCHLWSESYDRKLEDVFAIQEDIAKSTVGALEVALTRGDRQVLQKAPTTRVEAYDLYLRGRQYFYRWSRRDHDFAREMFSRAIEIDPKFTRAYAGLADTASYIYKHFESSAALLDEADAASAKALELDPELPEAHTSRGVVLWLKGRGEEADREFEAAIGLDPSLFDAHYLYGISCFMRGLYDRTVELFRQAHAIRPEDYQSMIGVGAALRGLGRSDEALAAFRRGLEVATRQVELSPDDARAWYLGASALVALGSTEQGLEWADRSARMEPDNPMVFENLAGIYAAAGRIDQGLDCIERAVELGLRHRGTLENDPDLDPLRSHPRFIALLDRV